MLSKDESKLDDLYDEIIKKYNTDPCILKCDLEKLNEDTAAEINKIINENYSGIDAVIFNAAILEKMSHIESYDLTTWERVLKINLTSIFLLSKNLIPLLKKASNPRIIFTSSSVGKKGKAFWGAYSVSKAGLNALSEIIADEVESVSDNQSLLEAYIIRLQKDELLSKQGLSKTYESKHDSVDDKLPDTTSLRN